VFVVEHDLDLMRRAQWLVDVGRMPENVAAACSTAASRMACARLPIAHRALSVRRVRPPQPGPDPTGWLELQGIHRHNLHGVDARIPLGVLTAVTGISGSGKSSLLRRPCQSWCCCTWATSQKTMRPKPASEGPAVIEANGGIWPATWTGKASGAGGPEADRAHAAF
jgi:excinuclease ABC subunit A